MKTAVKPNIFIGSDSLENLNAYLKSNKYSNVVIITDENTQKYCYPLISDKVGANISLLIKSGEENKELSTCHELWNEITKYNIDRNAIVINLGGGIICDLGGFVAATFKRGIDFIHIPTTLLAMCDACFGGKLGVNLNGLKNYIGLFKNPVAVFIYPNFLKTLPQNQIISGFAEVIKHAAIADKRFFNEICEMDDISEEFEKLISRSIRIKTRIVNLDSLETGIRKSLNFGHSIGHAIESYHISANPKSAITHGECVAAGMIAEAFISCKKNLLPEKELNQLITLIRKFFNAVLIDEGSISAISDLVSKDKKNENSDKLFTLIDGIGQFRVNEKISEDEIVESLKFYRNL
jgi:3-dehydroquinate synthase